MLGQQRNAESAIDKARLLGQAFLGLFAPRALSAILAEADHARELESNTQLRGSSAERQAEAKRGAEKNVVVGLLHLRRALSVSFLIMAAAVGAAWILARCSDTHSQGAPGLLGVASMFCFAWATLGRLGWTSWTEESVVERLDQFIFKALYWLGMFFGTLALTW